MIMEEAALSPLARWESFYVIVGSSAGALTGLQFVVIALVAEAQSAGGMLEIRAFGTPTVVHFCAVLLVSAVLSAPWQALSNAGFVLEACGAAGVAYAIVVIRHARRQTSYAPDAEDWFWYAGLPLVGYAGLLAAAILLAWHPTPSLFVIATTSLLLLFVGIHNAWDTVTYIAVEHRQKRREKGH
jgi:hypothetical protein